MSDNGVKIILHADFGEFPVAGNMFLYTFYTDKLEKIHEGHNPYRTSLVVTASRVAELQNILNKYRIYEVFILGDSTGLNITNKGVRINETNEQDLRFDLLCAAARYIHREEIIQRNGSNHGVANALRRDYCNLFKQLKEIF